MGFWGGRSPHSLVEQRAHNCAAVGGGVVHQRVEVGQQRVADVQHIPGDILKRGVPRHGVLPLKRENSVISFGRKEKMLKICSFFPIFVVVVVFIPSKVV